MRFIIRLRRICQFSKKGNISIQIVAQRKEREKEECFALCSSVLMSYKCATQGTMLVVLQLVT